MFNSCEYHDWLIDKAVSSRTIQAYLGDLFQFAAWFCAHNGDDLEPKKLTGMDWRDYRAFLLNEKFSSATINRKLAAIQSYATWCIKSKQVDYNPLDGARGIRRTRQAPHWLDRREKSAILRELERSRMGAKTSIGKQVALRNWSMVGLMLNTGIRVGELTALRWGDITIKDRSGLLKIRAGKGCKSREIPLNAAARSALETWRDGNDCIDLVFPIAPRSVQIALSEVGQRAHLDLTPHKLRHTFAKSLIDAGVSIDQVAQLLGHDHVETTIIYTIPSSHDLVRDVELLD